MLITITRTLVNQVHKATVATEVSTLETDYFKAYGEPRVMAGGELTIVDPVRESQVTVGNVAVLGVEADTGRTIVFLDPLLVDLSTVHVGDTATFAGVTHEPLLNGAQTILAIDAIHSSIAIDKTGIVTENPFERAVSEGLVTIDPLPALNQAITGFVISGPNVVLHVPGLDLSGIIAGDSAVISGVTHEPLLNGTHVLAAVDDTAKTISFITPVGIVAGQPTFMVADPKGDVTVAPALVPFTAPTSEVYVRSGLPLDFAIDGKTDLAAEQKVTTWARDLRTKIVAAVTALKTKPSPRTYPVLESTEI